MDAARGWERTEVQAHVAPALDVAVGEILPRACNELWARHREIAFHPEHRALPAGEAARGVVARHARHLREGNPEDLLARPIERHAEPLRSEEHTSELQSRSDLVCRLL